MKKLLLILSITLISNTSYASFPVVEKSQAESAQISNFGDNENRNILLLALAVIPLGIIGVVGLSSVFSTFLITKLIFGLVLLAAILSPFYSLYLNLNIPLTFWDWRNYFAFFISVVLGIPILIISLGFAGQIS
ncbi:hypothetical protein OAQ21_01050 [Flavobacteriales bacterium]|jgi:hypothetical protein|nr:hypothetical protein [Flavobacteriales bacterium]